MADTTTELEVLDQIVDVLGGQSGQYETVVPTLQQILTLLGGGGGGGGYNPALSVGRADALTGADETAQWATRESTGSGSAIVRSVQGAAVVWNQMVGSDTSSVTVPSGHKYLGIIGGASAIATSDGTAVSVTGGTDQLFDLTQMFGAGNEPATVAEFEAMYPADYYPYSAPTLKPVQIAGIRSTDAQGGELDSVEWDTFTLRGAGAIGDMLYSDHVETRVGVSDADANWNYGVSSPNENGIYYISMPTGLTGSSFITNLSSNLPISTGSFSQSTQREFACNTATVFYRFPSDHTPTMAEALADLRANNAVCYYPTTPTTTPLSPALSMSYKVEQGGTESIIVPDGEVSAAPVLTIAEGESAAELVMDALACIATPDGPTATANHAVNTYLTMQGKLYKVTSAIAVGESITPNTNVTETTVMAELLALTA